jgi:hypothetical protein
MIEKILSALALLAIHPTDHPVIAKRLKAEKYAEISCGLHHGNLPSLRSA